MADAKTLKSRLASGEFDARLKEVYLSDKAVEDQKKRDAVIIDEFVRLFGDNDSIELFSAPGRTEVGGNHTDHNHGKVLAASVDLDTVAAAAKRDDGIIVEMLLRLIYLTLRYIRRSSENPRVLSGECVPALRNTDTISAASMQQA